MYVIRQDKDKEEQRATEIHRIFIVKRFLSDDASKILALIMPIFILRKYYSFFLFCVIIS